jgi:peptidoglycan endopeptidase LytF
MMQVFAQNGGSGQALVVREAVRYLGAPYRYGGTSPLSGLDCSAFVQQVFARRGVRLPRTAAEQAQVGIPVSVADLRPGDRLYFSVRGRRVDHCGIYIGNGLFIHASGRHDAVVISRLDEPLYARSLVAIRRD